MQDVKNGFKIKFTSHELIVVPGQRIHLTRYSYQAKDPSNISMYARKHLKNSRVVKVEQHGFDRVLVISLDNGFHLVFEMFSKGNLVITREGKTRQALRYESWKDREIKPRKDYLFPEPRGLDPRKMALDEFRKIFDQDDVIRSLAKNVNMSGKYLEEVCHRAGVDKNKKQPSPEEQKRLFQKIQEVLKERRPGIQGKPVVFPFQSSSKKFQEKQSFNQALDEYYSPDKPVEELDTSGLEHRLKQQEKALEELGVKEKENKEKADLIYENLHDLKQLFKKIESMKKQGKNWEEIQEATGVEINPKTGKIKLKL
jgi:predicted ribosome quality control (RQC) complex YloA/Tae2 family protein